MLVFALNTYNSESEISFSYFVLRVSAGLRVADGSPWMSCVKVGKTSRGARRQAAPHHNRQKSPSARPTERYCPITYHINVLDVIGCSGCSSQHPLGSRARGGIGTWILVRTSPLTHAEILSIVSTAITTFDLIIAEPFGVSRNGMIRCRSSQLANREKPQAEGTPRRHRRCLIGRPQQTHPLRHILKYANISRSRSSCSRGQYAHVLTVSV